MPYFEDLVKILADVVPPEHWDKVKDLIPLARVETMAARYGTSFSKDGLYIERHANQLFSAKKMGNNKLYIYYNKQKNIFETIQMYSHANYMTLDEALQLLIDYKKEEPKTAEEPVLDEVTTLTNGVDITFTNTNWEEDFRNVLNMPRGTLPRFILPRRRGTR